MDIDGFRAAMREDGIEEIVEPTLALYVREAARLFSDLSGAVAAGDVETVRRTAHTLKSSSMNIRATELAGLLERLETAAGWEDTDRIEGLFGRVRDAYEAVVTYLAASAGEPEP